MVAKRSRWYLDPCEFSDVNEPGFVADVRVVSGTSNLLLVLAVYHRQLGEF